MNSRLAVVALVAAACNSSPTTPANPAQSTSTLALSSDDALLYAVEADSELLVVIDTRTDEKVAEVKVGAGAHLVAVGSDDTIYVANRYGKSVSVIRRGEWQEAAHWAAGAEPVGLTVSPDAKTLYVVSAVAADTATHGSVLALDTATGEQKWDLAVGPEPRSLSLLDGSRAVVSLMKEGDVQLLDLEKVAVTRSSTDTFEKMNKTAFENLKVNPDGVDTQHPRNLGAVVAVPDSSSILAVGITARQGPQAAWGGCAGTLLAAPAMYSFDPGGNSQADDVFACSGSTGPATIMNPPGRNIFGGQVDDQPLLQGPSAIAVERSGRWMYVAHMSSNNVAVISTVQDRSQQQFGFSQQNVDYMVNVGRGPNGIAVRRDGTKAYVLNAFDHTVSVLGDDGRHGVAKVKDVTIGADVLPPNVVAGRKLFFDATDSRMSGSTLGAACATCHTDNGQEDGHVWTFVEGKRQTMSLAGGRLAGTEPFHWDGRLENMDVLMQSTTKDRMGGHGTTTAMSNEVLAYLNSLPAAVNPKRGEKLTDAQARGAIVYQRAECGTCHGGEKLTNNQYAHVGTDETNPTANFGFAGVEATVAFPNNGVNVPSLLGLARTAPYLHDGTIPTLKERILTGKAADLHGKTSSLSDQDVDDLVEYLEVL